MSGRSPYAPEPSPSATDFLSPAEKALRGIPMSRHRSTNGSAYLRQQEPPQDSRHSSLDGTTFLNHATNATESSSLNVPSSSGSNGQLEAKIVLLGSQGVGKTSSRFPVRSPCAA
jgi:hypothetical protein